MIPSDPPKPSFSWPALWWSWLMDLWVWLKTTQAIPDPADFMVSETKDGRMFSLYPAPLLGSRALSTGAMFECSLSPDSTTSAAKIDVRKGTINDLDDETGMSVSGDTTDGPDGSWQFSMGASQTKYLVATANFTGITVSSADLDLQTSPPTTDEGDPDTGDAPASAYRKIAKFVTDSDCNLSIEFSITGPEQAVCYTGDAGCTTETKAVMWLP